MLSSRRNRSVSNISRAGMQHTPRGHQDSQHWAGSRSPQGRTEGVWRQRELQRREDIKYRLIERIVRAELPPTHNDTQDVFSKLTPNGTPRFRPCIRICPDLTRAKQNPFEARHKKKSSVLRQMKNSLFPSH